MVVQVYGAAQAACPQRVLACLIEKDIDFELIHVDLASGEHKKAEFLLRQPFGQIPATQDGELKLFESRAIIRYYAAKYADRGTSLVGDTLEERALVDQWLEVEAHTFNDLVYTLVMQLVVLPRMGQRGDQSLVHSYEKKLEKVLEVYENRLSTSKYLAGDEFTLADLSHLPGIQYLTAEAGLGHLITDKKAVSAWWDAISGRPAWKKVLELVKH